MPSAVNVSWLPDLTPWELRKLVEVSGELSDVLLSALDARRRMLKRIGEGGLVLAGDDDDRDLHRLQDFAERNQIPTERCCALIGRLGQIWRRPVPCPRLARPW